MFSKTYSAVVGVVLCSFLLARQNLVFGQAPGDEDGACRQGMNAPNHVFPPEWRVLVDTYDYQNLFAPFGFPSPVWVPVSLDGDALNWMQNVAGACTWSMSVCTGQLVQNNWLFSQYISYEDAREVFFDVSYRFTACSEPSCNKRYVTLYQYNRASLASDSDRMDPGMYQPLLGNEVASRLVQPPDVTNSGTEDVLNIPRPASNGFYLGLRDEGTCGDVTRIIVYYVVCPSRVEGLVTYPETGVPVRSGADIVFDARCAPNAHNTTTLQVTAFASSSSCSPVAPGGARCQCSAGYLASTNGLSCEACPAGTYRTLGDSSCSDCPGNTVTDISAASRCDCINGFFRATNPIEGPETGCTEPPSAITNLQVTSRADTTTTISWDRPATTGRADFFYRVFYSDPDNIGEFILARDNLDGSAVMYQLTGLVPFTSYIIRVTTHNGVSDQDPEGANARVSEVSTTTREGIPGQPSNVQRLCSVVVWQAPLQPNGVITGYDIQFFIGAQSTLIQVTGRTFYITANAEREPGTTSRVRAVNSAGMSPWTTSESTGCGGSGGGDCPPADCPAALPVLHFELRGTTYLNNTVVLVDDIGEGDNALLCVTSNEACCSNQQGEFYYPDESRVPTSSAREDFYRNRASQFIRLNRRNGAASPTGRYRCEIPDAGGVLQRIFIDVVASGGECPATTPPPPCTCPTTQPPPVTTQCPVVTCPTMQPPPTTTPCPVVTCPTIQPPPTCPVVTCPTTRPPPVTTPCPVVTCPTTQLQTGCPTPTPEVCSPSSCPECSTSSPLPPLHFELRGTTYLNNTVVLVDDIGEGDNALLCVTSNEACCSNRQGEFYYPDASLVPTSDAGEDFYRNRGSQFIRLNRRNGAASPTGRYRCEIPDAGGVLQRIFIDVVPSRITADTTCPSCPPMQGPVTCAPCSCPTTQPPCGEVTCELPTTCEDCPVVCPTPGSCPVCPQPPTTPQPPMLHFELRGTTYQNNTEVMVDEIGEGDNALFCVTSDEKCCDVIRKGEFYYPDGSMVPISDVGQDFYRNRDNRLIRLNRRNGAASPLGQYRCEIPDESGVTQSLVINIAPPRSPTTNIKDMIETASSFVGALESPIYSETLDMVMSEVNDSTSTITIEIDVTPGKYLFVVSKRKLRMLVRGQMYAVQIDQFPDNRTPFMFDFREEIPQPGVMDDGNNYLVAYIVVTAVVAIILTAIIAGLIMAGIVYCLSKKYKNSNVFVPSKTAYMDKNQFSSNKDNGSVEMTEKI